MKQRRPVFLFVAKWSASYSLKNPKYEC